MTITFYANWEEQEIYQNDKELIDGYIEHYCDENAFRDWLDENYNSDIIFAFTENKKEEVKIAFQEYLLQAARNWARDNSMEQEINI